MSDSTGAQAVTVQDIEVFAESLDYTEAARIYKQHGCLVVRGLMNGYIDALARDIEQTAAESIAMLDRAVKVPEGWTTPNGTLFLPAPANFDREPRTIATHVHVSTRAW